MNPVQQKISCVYKTGVVDEPSNKRQRQMFRVAATKYLNKGVVENGISSAKVTEKIDGTCCLIAEFEGQPWLWARHDRKPSKVGERRFTQYKRSLSKASPDEVDKQKVANFEWNPSKDFKEVPEHWMPALRLKVIDGMVMPDEMGHTPGWVPVQRHHRHHCWHLEAVDFVAGMALILRPMKEEEEGGREEEEEASPIDSLVIECVPLSSLLGQTCELIGTNINGNPYGLGCKQRPFHILVPHGAIGVTCPDPLHFDLMADWMTSDTTKVNQVEGIVWHCADGQLYKLHRHHLNLKWPVDEPYLCQRSVHVRVGNSLRSAPSSSSSHSDRNPSSNSFGLLDSINNQIFESLRKLCDKLNIQ